MDITVKGTTASDAVYPAAPPLADQAADDTKDLADTIDPGYNRPIDLPGDRDPDYEYHGPLDSVAITTGAAAPIMLDSNLSMSEVFQAVQEAYQRMASTVKEMATNLAESSINLRQEVFRKQLAAAKAEKSVSIKKVITSSAISIGAGLGGFSLGAKALKKMPGMKRFSSEVKREKEYTKLLNEHPEYANNPEKIRSAVEEYQQEAKLRAFKEGSQTNTAMSSAAAAMAPGAGEALFAGKTQEILTQRSEADFQRSVQDQFTKNSERSENEYQDYRRKALENMNLLVQIHGQAQQSANWRA